MMYFCFNASFSKQATVRKRTPVLAAMSFLSWSNHPSLRPKRCTRCSASASVMHARGCENVSKSNQSSRRTSLLHHRRSLQQLSTSDRSPPPPAPTWTWGQKYIKSARHCGIGGIGSWTNGPGQARKRLPLTVVVVTFWHVQSSSVGLWPLKEIQAHPQRHSASPVP